MKKFLPIIILFFALTSASTASAADLSLHAPSTISAGQTFGVSLLVNTDSTPINSVDISISYPPDLLTFKGYSEEGSVVKIWLKQPSADTPGIVSLSGIIPGGADGLYNPNLEGLGPLSIVKLLFVGKDSGTATFKIDQSSILENDGHGTSLPHQDINTSITIENAALPSQPEKAKNISDSDIPDPFTIQFIDSGYFSRTPPLLIFSTRDAQSGIAKYEMDTGNSWMPVSSPLAISKSIFSKNVTIRAVDYDGNSREASITIPGFMSPGTLAFFIIVLVIFAYTRILWYKKRT